MKKHSERRLALPTLAWLLAACAGPATQPIETPPDMPAPYPPAVAARFPAPPVHYDTPAFAPGRHAYTTDEELASALRAVAAKAGAHARLLALGRSEAGVPIEAVLFARADGVRRPRVLLVGQQHGDEPAPAEALLVTARELAARAARAAAGAHRRGRCCPAPTPTARRRAAASAATAST